MADEIKKSVIIQVDLDIDSYTKELQKLNGQVAALNKSQAELKKEGKQGSEQFTKNQLEVSKYNKQISDLKRVINNATVANEAQTNSNVQLKAALSAATFEYNKLSEEQKTTTQRGQVLKDQISGLTETLKANESAVGDNRRNVGNYGTSLKELKNELKNLKGELTTLDAGSAEYQAAAKRAGELDDKIKDINADVKAQSGDTGFEKLSNTTGVLTDKLKNLDFKGVAEQANNLATISKGMTFKEVTGGLKDMVSGLGGLAKAILTNPLFIMAATVIAVGLALKEWSDTVEERAVKATERLSAAIGANIEYQNDLIEITQHNNDIQQRLAQSQGKSELEMLALKRQGLEDDHRRRVELQNELNNSIDQLNKELNNTTNEDLRKSLQEQLNDIFKQKQDNKKVLRDYNSEVKILANEEQSAVKENNKKIADDYKKRLDKQVSDLDRLRQLQIDNISDDYEKQRQQAAFNYEKDQRDYKGNKDILRELAIKFSNEVSAIDAAQAKEKEDKLKDSADKQKEINDKARKQQDAANEELTKEFIAEDEKRKASAIKAEEDKAAAIKKINEATIEGISQGLNNIVAIQNNRFNSEIQQSEQSKNSQIEDLKEQLDRGVINQQQYDKRVAKINDDTHKKEAKIKRKQFELNKRAAEIQIGIKTAEAVITAYTGDPYSANALAAIALIVGATELAVVESAPVPEFAKGGRALSGKRITRNDGRPIHKANGDNLLATVRTNEVILNEQQQAKLGGAATFRAIGVPGFASGGATNDGGLLASTISNSVDNQVAMVNAQVRINRTLPAPIVIVEDINSAQDNHVNVVSRGDIG